MSSYQLAQLNIAHLLEPLESPRLAEFVANLERINALAENAPGFVWRLQTEEGDATGIRDFGEDYIVNLSVWRDVESLKNFVYHSAHAAIMSRRREWFNRMSDVYSVLWWVEAGHQPSTSEAKEKLTLLNRSGPRQAAFTFKKAFPAPAGGKTCSGGDHSR